MWERCILLQLVLVYILWFVKFTILLWRFRNLRIIDYSCFLVFVWFHFVFISTKQIMSIPYLLISLHVFSKVSHILDRSNTYTFWNRMRVTSLFIVVDFVSKWFFFIFYFVLKYCVGISTFSCSCYLCYDFVFCERNAVVKWMISLKSWFFWIDSFDECLWLVDVVGISIEI